MDWPVCMNKNDIYFGELVLTPTSVLRSSIALAHHFSHRVTFIRAELSLSSSWLSLGYSRFARVTHLRWVISTLGARLSLISLRSIAKSRLSLEMGVPFPSTRPRLYHCPVDCGEAPSPSSLGARLSLIFATLNREKSAFARCHAPPFS